MKENRAMFKFVVIVSCALVSVPVQALQHNFLCVATKTVTGGAPIEDLRFPLVEYIEISEDSEGYIKVMFSNTCNGHMVTHHHIIYEDNNIYFQCKQPWTGAAVTGKITIDDSIFTRLVDYGLEVPTAEFFECNEVAPYR